MEADHWLHSMTLIFSQGREVTASLKRIASADMQDRRHMFELFNEIKVSKHFSSARRESGL
jgi:hypothetical protein